MVSGEAKISFLSKRPSLFVSASRKNLGTLSINGTLGFVACAGAPFMVETGALKNFSEFMISRSACFTLSKIFV